MTNAWNETSLTRILSRCKLKDIYNADEFGLFYQGSPKKTLHMEGKKCSGGLVNRNGSCKCCWREVTNICGKSAKPRCFKNVKSIPYHYRSQIKSWMNSFLFDEWVKELGKKFEKKIVKLF